jgi:acetate---CoA ligase (ADP-forming)
MTPDSRARLASALNPKAVAIVGASDNPDKIGGRPLAFLARHGFRGRIFPINPGRDRVQGLVAYPSLEALPERADLVVIAVPGDAAMAAVEASAAHGADVAIVITSGFGETDEAGRAKERRMVETARAAGMRMIGPNTQGLANLGTGAVTSFSTMFLESEPQDGPVGIVSQSGAMSVVPYGLLRSRGIGIRHVHATGNDADVTACELACVVAEDPALRLLILYLEGLPDPWHLAELARIAHARDLPVMVLKSGRTAAGQAAARSHTGALANEDRVVDAFFRQYGIRRVRDMGECVDSAELYLKGWRPSGGRLVAISNSGAVCVQAADAASDLGMPLATLTDATLAQLGRILPSFATTRNPIDITAALLSNSRLFGDILPVLAADPGADAFVIGIPVAGQGYDIEGFARDTADFAAATGKPIVASAPMPVVAAPFAAAGVTVYRTEFEAVRALHGYLSHLEAMRRATPGELVRARRTDASAHRMLNESDSLATLARLGIPTVECELCRTGDEAAAAAARLGGTVAVKGCSAEVVHKTELGLVRLGVLGPEAVRAAFAAVTRAAAEAGVRLDGVLVARQAKGRLEMMIGAHVDPGFGPVVVFGQGGKYVEAMPDVALLLPPFDASAVRDRLAALRCAPLFAGVRGEPALAVEALCDAVVRIGDALARPDNTLVSVDLNPVLLCARGEGCVAVDAVVWHAPPDRPAAR